jgi:hypothetical protein
VRAKNENEEAFVSFTEMSTKESKKIKVGSNKKKPMPYKVDYYQNTTDNGNNKNDYNQERIDKHKRSKSQNITSIKGRKGNSSSNVDTSVEEMSHLLKQHLTTANNKTAYHLVNEYLENPGKHNNITITSNNQNHENKAMSRSRGKRVHNVSNNGLLKGKRPLATNTSLLKQIAFKSFDKRRAGTNLDRREGSFEDPLFFMRSSSACHKYIHEKSSAGKKSNRASKGITNKSNFNLIIL